MSISNRKLLEIVQQRERASASMPDYALATIGIKAAAHHLLIYRHLHALVNDEYDDLVINTPPGSAKALALDTPIPTPHGWTRMGDLYPGCEVFDESGKVCRVVAVSPVFRNRPVYSVTTDCGDEVIADRDHEWLVRLCGKQKQPLKGVDRWGNPTQPRSRDPVFKIKETHVLHRKRSKRPMIARAAALDLPTVDLPVDPYLLGVWLGDGTSASMSISSSDDDRPWLRAELSRLGYVTSDRSAHCLFGVLGVIHLFDELGLVSTPASGKTGRKHIPPQYLRASREQRLHLLQGLIDTDGTVCRKRGSTTFCNTNLELALQVRELVRSLGVKAGWSESRAVLNGVDHGAAYKVSFYLKDSARLPRKAVLTRNQYRTPDTYVDVVPAGTADTVCIQVDSPSRLFLCGRSMTPTHNSTLVSHVFPSWYMSSHPRNNVIIASHTTTLAERWSRRSRDTLASPESRLIFPDAALSADSTAVSRWATSQGGECVAAGVGMAILGTRADLICIDDPISGWEQANSITQLQKLHDWYKTDLKSRLKPGGKIVLVCQRLSANDLAGFMIDSHKENPTRRLRVLNLPMVADSPDDPLGRPIGGILWPDWFTPEMVADHMKDDFIWRTMWQQQPPSDTGSWVSPEEVGFRPTPEITPDTAIYGSTDLALSVNTGDYTVHIIVAVNDRGEWDIVDAQRARVDPDTSANTIVGLCGTYRPREWAIDDDNASKVFMQLVATRAMSQSTFVPWRPVPLRGQDKETRAAALRGHFKRRMVFMPKDAPFTRWLLNEIFGFPNLIGQGVDDGIDALSTLGRRLLFLGKTAPAPEAAKPPLGINDMTLNQLFEDREHRRAYRARV